MIVPGYCIELSLVKQYGKYVLLQHKTTLRTASIVIYFAIIIIIIIIILFTMQRLVPLQKMMKFTLTPDVSIRLSLE